MKFIYLAVACLSVWVRTTGAEGSQLKKGQLTLANNNLGKILLKCMRWGVFLAMSPFVLVIVSYFIYNIHYTRYVQEKVFDINQLLA